MGIIQYTLQYRYSNKLVRIRETTINVKPSHVDIDMFLFLVTNTSSFLMFERLEKPSGEINIKWETNTIIYRILPPLMVPVMANC